MVIWSVIVAVLGVGGVAALMARKRHRWSQWSPERFWLLGMGALAPAWLIAFLALLASSGEALPKGAFIGSSSLPLIGVIVTDAVVKRLRESDRDHHGIIYWFLGVAALLPAWVVAFLSVHAVAK